MRDGAREVTLRESHLDSWRTKESHLRPAQFLCYAEGASSDFVNGLSGIILLKYWLEISQEEQARRLKSRVDDGRKTWKLSPMDLESYRHWYDYSRARDAMIQATDTPWAPLGYVVYTPMTRGALVSTLSLIC